MCAPVGTSSGSEARHGSWRVLPSPERVSYAESSGAEADLRIAGCVGQIAKTDGPAGTVVRIPKAFEIEIVTRD